MKFYVGEVNERDPIRIYERSTHYRVIPGMLPELCLLDSMKLYSLSVDQFQFRQMRYLTQDRC